MAKTGSRSGARWKMADGMEGSTASQRVSSTFLGACLQGKPPSHLPQHWKTPEMTRPLLWPPPQSPAKAFRKTWLKHRAAKSPHGPEWVGTWDVIREAHWHTWHLQSLGVIASLGFGFLTYKMEIKHVLPLQGGRDNHEKIKSSATTVLSQQRLVTDHQ